MKLVTIINKLRASFLEKNAADWDFVGWQVKSKNKNIEIDSVLIALDVTEVLITQAIKNKIKLIIVHHPFIFAKSISVLENSSWKKELYHKLIKNDINVFVLHTNFDKNSNGMGFLMAKDLKLNDIKYFDSEKFSVVGSYNNLPLKEVITNIKNYYGFDQIKVITNNLETKINKIIIAPGAGGIVVEFLKRFVSSKNDISLVVTGEMKWHQELEARDKNISVLVLGHEMEEKFVNFIVDFLNNKVFLNEDVKLIKYFAIKAKII